MRIRAYLHPVRSARVNLGLAALADRQFVEVETW